jgi:proteic killer suppression protein
MIRSFRDRETERVFRRERRTKFSREVARAALRKLLVLDAAETLADLRVPPGNRLEKLAGNRAGQYSIRVNDQWRICFRWVESDAHDAQIVDYH